MAPRGTGASAAPKLLAIAGAVVLSALALAPGGAAAVPVARDAAAVTASPSPTGTSTVRGVLTLGTAQTPVSGTKVTLHGVANGADPVTASVTTDAKGRWSFGGLAGGDAWAYTATAEHQGTQFTTDVISVKAGETQTTTLPVFDVTTSPEKVIWTEWLVWLDNDAAGLAVQQDLTMHNSGSTAYTGSVPVPNAPDNGKAAVVLPVTSGATSLSYLGTFETCCDAVVGGSWQHTRPVLPGSSTGTLRYVTPTPSELTFPVPVQTSTLKILVPSGAQVTSAQLTATGTQTDRGVTYQVLQGGPFAPGTTVTLAFASESAATWVWILVGAVGLVLVGGAFWFWRRSRTAAPAARPAPTASRSPKQSAKQGAQQSAKAAPKAGAPGKQGRKAGSAGAVAAAGSAATPSRAPAAAPKPAAPSRDDAAVLADELAMLDLAHENGALPDEASYQRVRESLVARLVAALGEDPDALDVDRPRS